MKCVDTYTARVVSGRTDAGSEYAVDEASDVNMSRRTTARSHVQSTSTVSETLGQLTLQACLARCTCDSMPSSSSPVHHQRYLKGV